MPFVRTGDYARRVARYVAGLRAYNVRYGLICIVAGICLRVRISRVCRIDSTYVSRVGIGTISRVSARIYVRVTAWVYLLARTCVRKGILG